MNAKILLFHILLLLLVSVSLCFPMPKLSPLHTILRRHTLDAFDSNPSDLPDYLETHYYNQTLDHFNFDPQSYNYFLQKYYINLKYWDGPNTNAPIFVYLGPEAPLDKITSHGIGFLEENAPMFKSLSLFIEHRFYGESNPLGSMEETIKNKEFRGYFNSVQALADYAQIIMHIKKIYSAQHSPVIVIGGSYGGMLAAWFRLKYPHVALGALASSAPVLNFNNLAPQDSFNSIVNKDFKDVSQNCYKTIRDSWAEIDRLASETNGLASLSLKFRTCGLLNNASELKDALISIYNNAAQYDTPSNHPVTEICNGIDGAPEKANILDKIFAGVSRLYYTGAACYNMTTNPDDLLYFGWSWQRCTDMVTPIGITNEDGMFQKSPFSLKDFMDDCKKKYDITTRPDWATTYYGGQDIKLVLKNFGSNIIFSNGLRDPFSSSGVLEDISDSILAVHTDKGSHCLDILASSEDDPEWLIDQRKREVNIIREWITKYNQDLRDS